MYLFCKNCHKDTALQQNNLPLVLKNAFMTTITSNLAANNYAESPRVQKFIKRLLNPFLFRIFLFGKLPMGFLAGLSIKHLDTQSCSVSVPYRWLNTNPFKSTYFAVLSMAGEMSTGVAGLMAIDWCEQPVSILVVKMESVFTKKAVDVSTFTCTQVGDFFEAVEHTVKTGEGVEVTAVSVGTNKAGEEVARFTVTWSLRAKRK